MKNTVLFLLLAISMACCSELRTFEEGETNIKSQETIAEGINYRSGVPFFAFSSDGEKQKVQLQINPLMKRFKESRRNFVDDPYRPIYHFVSPEGNIGVSLQPQGSDGKLISLDAWQMKNIYD